MRHMIDAANPANIPPGTSAELIAGYLTGTPGQAWNNHWNDFPGKVMVTIDQGAQPGAPNFHAMVMDVEPGAYRPDQITTWMQRAIWERPTVYCDRNDLPAVRQVWDGPVWLAAPNVTVFDDPNLIGIQNISGDGWDGSDIFDPYWPFLPPVTTGDNDMLHGMLLPSNGQEFVPFPAGAFKGIFIFHDFTHVPGSVRVAVHSKTHGYSLIKDVIVNNSIPEELMFTETDVDAVSLVNRTTVPVGWTLT